MLTSILKMLFGFPQEFQISNINRERTEAVDGPVFRVCATIHAPFQSPPYTEHNWSNKICAVVLFRKKILSFTVTRPYGYNGH